MMKAHSWHDREHVGLPDLTLDGTGGLSYRHCEGVPKAAWLNKWRKADVWQNDILVLPDDLIAFAWSAPMRDLAAKLELSDVGLKKLLTRCGVASPPQGY
ncbi:hypothetical protein [Mesorhizobium sp.]|nr:hypothetical protein [Mesorhizobium sp.]